MFPSKKRLEQKAVIKGGRETKVVVAGECQGSCTVPETKKTNFDR